MPKNDSVTNDGAIGSTLGDGGLQKWIRASNGNWSLAYTLAAGLNLVGNNGTSGTTGLFGLTGYVIDGNVQLFATNYTIGDTDQTYLYGITDLLSALARPLNEAFVQLDAAPVGLQVPRPVLRAGRRRRAGAGGVGADDPGHGAGGRRGAGAATGPGGLSCGRPFGLTKLPWTSVTAWSPPACGKTSRTR